MGSSSSKKYEVFARSQRGGPLYQIGIVEAFSDNLAKIYAQAIYDEENWFEMCVVQCESLQWVIKPKSLFRRGEVQNA